MGFLSGLMQGLSGNKDDDIDIVSMYNEDDEEDALIRQASGKKVDYRSKAFENSQSVNGKYQCVRCKRWFDKGDIDIDHIIPQSKGGDSTRYNLQCMCKHCNRSKQDDTSDTSRDLARRRRELQKQDDEDREFLKKIEKKRR